jgi:hypothetical protein
VGRLILRVILVAAILALCFYSHYEYTKRHSSIPQIKDDPQRYENVSFRSEGSVKDLRTEDGLTRFSFVVMGDDIEALYQGPIELREGDYVIVYGALHMTKGYLLVEKLHIYRDIRRLYALSVVGVVALMILFLRDWRFNIACFEWRRRVA